VAVAVRDCRTRLNHLPFGPASLRLMLMVMRDRSTFKVCTHKWWMCMSLIMTCFFGHASPPGMRSYLRPIPSRQRGARARMFGSSAFSSACVIGCCPSRRLVRCSCAAKECYPRYRTIQSKLEMEAQTWGHSRHIADTACCLRTQRRLHRCRAREACSLLCHV
jgi:hypothetical protein